MIKDTSEGRKNIGVVNAKMKQARISVGTAAKVAAALRQFRTEGKDVKYAIS